MPLSQNWSLRPNCICLGVVPDARDVICPALALLIMVPEGTSQFCTFNKLNASKRTWTIHPSRGSGKLLNIEMSKLSTAGPRNPLRPRFPNVLEGIAKAQGLNHADVVPTASGARPPCATVV